MVDLISLLSVVSFVSAALDIGLCGRRFKSTLWRAQTLLRRLRAGERLASTSRSAFLSSFLSSDLIFAETSFFILPSGPQAL